ncbi:MAG: cell division ATP-binding protein FtsE [Erysipelotrichales bacterium]|nr:cell division ATP-binding protein FtsE [Erysipelotrichales bacterium]
MIKLENVTKVYKTGTRALNGISLYINQGEFVYIIGATGSGKSTLIKILNGEEAASKGKVNVAGTDLTKLRTGRIPYFRRNVGVVYQDFCLLPKKTVFENVAFALEVVSEKTIYIRKRVREVLKLVDLEEKAKSFPNEISGGQKQRVAIGRAIANKPKVLIADEPTGNLDPEKSEEIIALLERINREEGTTILMVTHDKELVEKHKKRTILLQDGYIVADLMEGGYVSHD